MTDYLTLEPGTVRSLPKYGRQPVTHHVFDEDSIEAVNAALAAKRPLLLRGEPGTGKSQLARAVAAELGRAFIAFTVDARTESRDLLYSVDLVARLAEAQVVGHLPDVAADDVRSRLAESRYTSPGPLWWVLDWQGAREQATLAGTAEPWAPEGWQSDEGAVLLIDEIDKADTAVPNGLLEALGQASFRTPSGESVAAQEGVPWPLVLITTNEERALPDAFVRRCLVLQLAWPEAEDDLVDALVVRGRAHFEAVDLRVLRAAAAMVAEDRVAVAQRGVCAPGGAEFLDLVGAASARWPDRPDEQLAALKRIRRFALDKHPAEGRW